MNYLLDSCVLSEFTRRRPEPRVIAWMEKIDEDQLFVSVITFAEIQRGIERLPDSHRKTDLLLWMNAAFIRRFDSRILPLDTPTMLMWGSLTARMEVAGHPVGLMDSLITAAALHHNLIIATRNVTDFLPCGVQVINPWA